MAKNAISTSEVFSILSEFAFDWKYEYNSSEFIKDLYNRFSYLNNSCSYCHDRGIIYCTYSNQKDFEYGQPSRCTVCRIEPNHKIIYNNGKIEIKYGLSV